LNRVQGDREHVRHGVERGPCAGLSAARRGSNVASFVRRDALFARPLHESARARERLETTPVAADARGRGGRNIDRGVTDLGREPVRAPNQPSIEHEAAADAGPERDHEKARMYASVPEAGLAESGGRRIIFHDDARAEALLELGGKSDAFESRDVRQAIAPPVAIHFAGDSEADRGGRGDEIPDGSCERVQKRGGRYAGRSRNHVLFFDPRPVDVGKFDARPADVDANHGNVPVNSVITRAASR
jgi:hypothetical protein